MADIKKDYGNGKVLTIFDDGVSPFEVLKTKLEKVFTAPDGEQHRRPIEEATMNDLDTNIASLTAQINDLTAKLNEKIALKNDIQVELDKLPARVPPSPVTE